MPVTASVTSALPIVLPIAPQRAPPIAPTREALKGELLNTVALIERRRCSEIADGLIDGYVALNWMEWNGGSLRLTVTGQNVRRQLMTGVG